MNAFIMGTSKGEFVACNELYDADGTFTAPAGGKYRIVAIGKGANGYQDSDDVNRAGGCGGGGYVELYLKKGEALTIAVSTANSSVTNATGTLLISATAGNASTAGTTSGIGVTAFASNGTTTSDISAPSFYSDRYRSTGGKCGYSASSGTNPTQPSGRDGGKGLFGGRGGDGGDAIFRGFNETYKGYAETGKIADKGGGKGGDGLSGVYASGGATYQQSVAGSGGGGGYGGGGGKPANVPSSFRPTPTGAGFGGAGCVCIERIA